MTDHRVSRPTWTCISDGADWPCEPARQQLVEAYQDRAALATLLGMLMARAADELGVADPTDLYRRFLTWTIDATKLAGSAVVSGTPPWPSCRHVSYGVTSFETSTGLREPAAHNFESRASGVALPGRASRTVRTWTLRP
jgi:hypothetical protein